MTGEGDAQLILASTFFDASFYAKAAGSQFVTPEDAARHYLNEGWISGRNPSTRFDGAYYLDANEDVRDAGLNPLVHFLHWGHRQGRQPLLSRAPIAPPPKPPDGQPDWVRLRAENNVDQAENDDGLRVDVLVSVHRGYDETLACLHSVLSASNRTPYRLIVMEDDPEYALSVRLRDLAQLGLFTLLKSQAGLGPVQTVNRGLALSLQRDVVLLNSHAVVYGDWLDRLRFHALASDRVATVAPFSNNAGILSYPFAQHNNRQLLELDYQDLDAVFAKRNHQRSTDVPIGASVCLYIARKSLHEVGVFDERLFGRGRGKETDFCMRASARGWRNLAAQDVFVRHTRSFSEVEALTEEAHDLASLKVLYADHGTRIRAFIKADPLRSGRAEVDLARFAALSRGRGILMVSHNWGGGIERHVQDLSSLLSDEDIPSLTLKPSVGKEGLALFSTGTRDFPNLPIIPWSQIDGCAALLKALHLQRVHIHSLVAIAPESLLAFLGAVREAGLEYDFSIHDYVPICPRVSMIDWSGMYCDSPSANYCRECIDRLGTPFGSQDIGVWRARYRDILLGARNVYAPSADVITRMARYLPERSHILLRPSPLRELPKLKKLPPPGRKGVRTVGLIGQLGDHKGERVIQSMAADALARELPIHFVLYGYSDSRTLDSYRNVTITGPYQEEEIDDLLASDPCDIVFFASVCPESFSYTLDHAVRNGIFPVAFDIGAIAARIRSMGYGLVIPLAYATDSYSLNKLLLEEIPPAPPLVHEESRIWQGAEKYYGGH